MIIRFFKKITDKRIQDISRSKMNLNFGESVLMKRCGFSIVELIIAIGILSLILLISIPRFDKERYTFREDVEKFKINVRNYRMEAMDTHKEVVIYIDKTGYVIKNSGRLYKKTYLNKGNYILSKFKSISFYQPGRTGAPSMGCTVFIYNEKNKYLERLTVAVASGRIHSYVENYYDPEIKSNIDHYMKYGVVNYD